MTPDLSRALVGLHADMHPEREAIRGLLAAGVASTTILSLYPLDIEVTHGWLTGHLAQWHVAVRFVRTFNDKFMLLDPNLSNPVQQKWLTMLSAEHGNALHALYESAGETEIVHKITERLLATVKVENKLMDDVRGNFWPGASVLNVENRLRYKTKARLKSIHCRLLIAEQWADLPELHGLERDFARELAGVRYALCL